MKQTLSQVNKQSNLPNLKIDAILLHSLNTSPNDRDFVLRVEAHLFSRLFRHEEGEVTFYDLNSYYRMLVHRVTRYYDLERIADSVLRTVTVFRPLDGYERPIVKLADLVEPDAICPPETSPATRPSPSPSNMNAVVGAMPKLTIMKRNPAAETFNKEPSSAPVKSLEEREREYEAARARIFQQESVPDEDNSTVSPTMTTTETEPQSSTVNDEEEVIHFRGWKDIDAIKPFIQESFPPSPLK